MDVPEYLAKGFLAGALRTPPAGKIAESANAAGDIAAELGGPVAIKAQIPAGKRGKSGGIAFADTPAEARAKAEALIGATVAGFVVERVLVEPRITIVREFYAAVLNDGRSKKPLVLFSTEGGMDIEDVSARTPEKIVRANVDIRKGFDHEAAGVLLAPLDLHPALNAAVREALVALYATYIRLDAQLLEVNPLVLDGEGALWALDCKLTLDDSARPRQAAMFERLESALGPQGTALERRAKEAGLFFIELDGDVGVLANGAGLTMTSIDAVAHFGGKPANFMEIGGDAYTKAIPALEIVLANPRVKSLLVNFCGAFARTDVMTEGVIAAIEALKPTLPIFFSIHGTGEDIAIPLLRERLKMEPYDDMDDAVKAAVAAAREAAQVPA